MLHSNLRVCVCVCVCVIPQTGRSPPWCCWWPALLQPLWPFWWPWFPSAGGRREGTTAPWLCSSSPQVRPSPPTSLLLSNPKTPEIICTFLPRANDLPGAPTHHACAHLETEGRRIRAVPQPQPQQFPYRLGVFCSSADIKWKGAQRERSSWKEASGWAHIFCGAASGELPGSWAKKKQPQNLQKWSHCGERKSHRGLLTQRCLILGLHYPCMLSEKGPHFDTDEGGSICETHNQNQRVEVGMYCDNRLRACTYFTLRNTSDEARNT